MQLNETSRFLLLTLGVFCLTLGVAVLLLSLIERVFFAVGFVNLYVELSSIVIVLGAVLLLWCRRTSA